MAEEAFSLFELNNLVRMSLAKAFPSEYWVQAELSEVREHPNGHCYVEFVQKNPSGNGMLAKARGTIWNNVYRMLKPYFETETGQPFAEGLKVLVKVTVEFHELYGFSLTVVDIDPNYTLGDMARKRREILSRLEAEGVLSLNKELPLPMLVQRIAVISSATAAGYGDFCHQLQHNPDGFVFYLKLFPALMQGNRVEESVIAALNLIYSELNSFDAVVIIRGGGATSDLAGFDSYDLAVNCAQFPLPIITGLGHERDDTVIDFVAHTRAKTPTAAAEFIISCAQQAAGELSVCMERIASSVSRRMQEEKMCLQNLAMRLPSKIIQCIGNEKYRLQLCIHQLETSLKSRMEGEKHHLQLLAQTLETASPERILQRGYSLTLKDGKAVKDAALLQNGDELQTRMAKGSVRSIVKK